MTEFLTPGIFNICLWLKFAVRLVFDKISRFSFRHYLYIRSLLMFQIIMQQF